MRQPPPAMEYFNGLLRKGELESLTIGQLHLDELYPYADLNPSDEKNREGSRIALRHITQINSANRHLPKGLKKKSSSSYPVQPSQETRKRGVDEAEEKV